jgi:hypothetical protein
LRRDAALGIEYVAALRSAAIVATEPAADDVIEKTADAKAASTFVSARHADICRQ